MDTKALVLGAAALIITLGVLWTTPQRRGTRRRSVLAATSLALGVFFFHFGTIEGYTHFTRRYEFTDLQLAVFWLALSIPFLLLARVLKHP